MVSLFLFPPLLSLLLLFSVLAANADLAADRAALLLLSSAVRGRTRLWNQSESNPCLWEGVSCDNATGRVTELRLPGDGLLGEIPANSVGNLTHLRVLSLRRNFISGPLPPDIGFCTELRQINLQGNRFAGEIPATLFGLSNLEVVNIAGNNFSGGISPGFSNFTQLKTLYLEDNHFTGAIPDLNSLTRLRSFNVSNNKLDGAIPTSLTKFSSDSFLGNSLCGSPLTACPGGANGGNTTNENNGNTTNENNGNTTNENNGTKLSAGAIAGIVIGSVFGLVLVLSALFILWTKFNTQKAYQPSEMSPFPPSPVKAWEIDHWVPNVVLVRENSKDGNGVPRSSPPVEAAMAGTTVRTGEADGLVFFGDGVRFFTLEELLMASAEVLGKGTFGTTYRAYLGADESKVIVKRLRDASVSEREFRDKVEALGRLAHENLVPLMAYFYGKEERLLVYEGTPMESLSALLHGNLGADRAPLTWEVRSKIALEVARGIEYLHSVDPYFSHGNIKSSHILLTDNFSARVSEFGISPLVSSSDALKLNGYCAPEVMDSCRITQKADIYSFGILILELLTGKAPMNASLDEEGVDLPRWVQSIAKEKQTIDVFDPELLRHRNREQQMVQLLHLGIYCASSHPDKRPSILEVREQIEEICG